MLQKRSKGRKTLTSPWDAPRFPADRRPAPSAGSRSGPHPWSGRARARLSLLLAPALLLGALSLPAAAQTPATPAHLTVRAGNAEFMLVWRSVEGARSYLIEWDENTATGFGRTAAATPTTVTYNSIKTFEHSAAEPVVDGTLYKARVRACSNANPIGAANLDCGGWTATLRFTPGAPRGMVHRSIGWGYILSSGKTLHVEWEPGSDNGSPITGYDVHYTTSWNHARDAAATITYRDGTSGTPDPYPGWVEILRSNRLAREQVIYEVPYGVYYRVRMRAVNAVGAGVWQEFSYILVGGVDAPNIARSVRVAPGDGKLTLTWEAPSKWGSWSPGGYEVQWKLASAASSEWAAVWQSGAAAVIAPGATSFEFTGQQQGSVSVTNGTAYDLRIRAWNKRPGTDGSAANDRRATPHWYPSKVSGTPTASCATCSTEGEIGVIRQPAQQSPYASLIGQIRGWRNEPGLAGNKAHTDRWDRALLAFGETVSDTTLTPMTAAEAQTYADRGWNRWVEVAKALGEIEASARNADPPPQPTQVPQPLHDSLIADVNTWRNDPLSVHLKPHTDRWDRVLLTLGEPVSDTSLAPMPATEAQTYADRGWSRWVGVVAALKVVKTGTSGADTLTGTSNGELLVGLAGDDDLSGLGGDDELRGGAGDDDLTGGAGSDRFVFFSAQTGAKAITDFASGDVVVLKGSGWSSVADIIAGVQAVGSTGYRYTLASGLTVETTNNRTLRTEDFVTD